MSETNPRLLFASYHAYPDPASGAALATRDLFEDFAARGWACRVVCGPQFDSETQGGVADALHAHGVSYYRERCAPPGGPRYDLFHYTLGGVPVTQFRPDPFDPSRPPAASEGKEFLAVVDRACGQFRPAVVLTYGGPPVAPHLIRVAARHEARVVFALHNLAYADPELFRAVDAVRVPSEFARAAYRDRVGVDAEAVGWPLDFGRALAEPGRERFVTFVNPEPAKGVAWFARIAAEVGRRRPDIPFLVVEGRGGMATVHRVPIDLTGANLHGLLTTPYPREFYARTRVLLVPSLCEETFGRVAAEGLANGIPVLATRRGALPETLGGAGFLFDVPDRHTGRLTDVPEPGEVAGWVAVIERLWDDEAFYQAHRAAARDRARAWQPDRLRPAAEDFFRRVAAGGPVSRSDRPGRT